MSAAGVDWMIGREGRKGDRCELYAHDSGPAELTNLSGSPDAAAAVKTAHRVLHRLFPPDVSLSI